MLPGIDGISGALSSVWRCLGDAHNAGSPAVLALAVSLRALPHGQSSRSGARSSHQGLASYDATLLRLDDGRDLLYCLVQASFPVDDQILKLLEAVHLS